MEPRWGPIIPLLTEFAALVGSPCPILKVRAANSRRWSQSEFKQRWRMFSRAHGVYLIFDADERTLLYVGKADALWFDKRVWTHDDDCAERRPGSVRGWTDVIAITDPHTYLIEYLEAFLIERLAPPCNSKCEAFCRDSLLREVARRTTT
jgi:hypothetical protein